MESIETVDAALPRLLDALDGGRRAVFVAPPGAGKTTRLPPALAAAAFMDGRRTVVVEPRRVAARAAAEFLARARGERVGRSVGLRMRDDTRTSAAADVEICTEGTFVRSLLADPGLDGVGAVVFDEVHERSLDLDLALALTLDAAEVLRPDLAVVAMSATLDDARLVALLATQHTDAPVVTVDGRAHPIEVRRPSVPREAVAGAVAAMDEALHAAHELDGDVLVFVPGRRELHRVAVRLEERYARMGVEVVALHGGLTAAEQARALEPGATRRVVVATSIAQTSVTLPRVRVVVDTGLSRVPRLDPRTGLVRLATVAAARSTAVQRAGRAGRTGPGVCLQLWSAADDHARPQHERPEILDADLTGVLLTCRAWGTPAHELRWLDVPPEEESARADALLAAIGALDDRGRLTERGRVLERLPVGVRQGAMLLAAGAVGAVGAGRPSAVAGEPLRWSALLAAVIEEGGTGSPPGDDDGSSRSADLVRAVAAYAEGAGGGGGASTPMHRAVRRSAARVERTMAGAGVRLTGEPRRDETRRDETRGGEARDGDTTPSSGSALPRLVARLLLTAYPDRLAALDGEEGRRYRFASGAVAVLDAGDPLAGAPLLVIADLDGDRQRGRIHAAAAVTVDDIEATGIAVAARRAVVVDGRGADTIVRAQVVHTAAGVELGRVAVPVNAVDVAEALLARCRLPGGIADVPLDDAASLRARVALLAASAPAGAPEWPDWSDDGLAATVDEWLAPALLGGAARPLPARNPWSAFDPSEALLQMLPYAQRAALESLAPTRWRTPTGRDVAIHYVPGEPPTLRVRLQHVFGCAVHPRVAGGAVALRVELLSPADRPIQVTDDLPRFWTGSYAHVRSQLRGRYPKHAWPEDPTRI